MDTSNHQTNNMKNDVKKENTEIGDGVTNRTLDPGKNRCHFESCNKKIQFSVVKCRCLFRFCNKHRHAEDHSCTYDYHTNGRERLQKDNPKIQFAKMEKI